jgi:hypothetical protein
MAAGGGSGRLGARSARRGLIAAVLTVLVAVPALIWAFRPPYWRYPDPDFILAYNGLLLAEGLPQEFFDHTAYVYLLALAGWYQLLHAIGLLGVHTVSALPPVADRAAFDAAWAGIVQAGRAMMLVTAIGFVVMFASLTGRWLRDWRLGLLAGLLLAGASGVVGQTHFMRTELLSSMLVVVTLFLVVLAPRQTPMRQLLFLAGAGLCAVLAVATKVFAVIPLAGLPILALCLMDRRSELPQPERSAPSTAAAVVLIGLLALIAAGAMVAHAISLGTKTAYAYKPVAFGIFGLYQALIAAIVVGAMLGYARIYGVPRIGTLMAAMALGAGVAVGVLALGIKFNEKNVLAILSPVEHMYVFSTWIHHDLEKDASVLSTNLVRKLVTGISLVLDQRLPIRRPANMIILEWLTIAGIGFGLRDRDRRWMWQAILLILFAWGIQVTFYLRGPSLWYFAYTDPFVVLAAVIVAARWQRLISFKPVRWAAVAVVLVYFVLGQLQLRAWNAAYHPDPKTQCEWHPAYLKRLEVFPFCRT